MAQATVAAPNRSVVGVKQSYIALFFPEIFLLACLLCVYCQAGKAVWNEPPFSRTQSLTACPGLRYYLQMEGGQIQMHDSVLVYSGRLLGTNKKLLVAFILATLILECNSSACLLLVLRIPWRLRGAALLSMGTQNWPAPTHSDQ